jgi:hypothetical protein
MAYKPKPVKQLLRPTQTGRPAAHKAHPNEFSKQKKAMKKADPYGTVKTHAARRHLKPRF